ncbi:beta strand repeat-containing protein [Alicyclobacillus suci]|uniref:beta strand repeat-containing protein n=1 Tax=Alicyclobacillus suci TaxID=2816080 RepID=UPI001A8D40FE|nr:hypothetical protein [Alicyclobacillus suci]
MKRSLTGIAAAAVVLGAMSPMAFAATSKATGLTKASQLPIVVNGKVLSNPYEMTGKDSGNTTGFFPIYYFNQALAKIGFTATWDGTTHTWAITAPNVDASSISVAGGVGTGNTTVTVNGTVVKKFNTQVAKDPAGGKSAQATTYLPIYYISNVLTALGVQGSFSGQTGLSITGGSTSVGGTGSISAPTVSGQAVGTGTQASPAVSFNSPLTVSATLTDPNGNPLVGVNALLDLTDGNGAPTVKDSNGNVLASTSISGGFQYKVPTNAEGVASAQVSVDQNVSANYTVRFEAPYNLSGTTATLKSSKEYIEFVAPNTLGVSPASGFNAAVSNSSNNNAGVVPVTVTIPPNSSTPQSGVQVTFSFGNNSAGAFFSTANGGSVGTGTQTVYTDSNGQAVVYVDSTSIGSATINVSTQNYGNKSTTINWNQSGVVTKLDNMSVSGYQTNDAVANYASAPYQANIGDNVTFQATAQDQNGNPVPNAQLLIVASETNTANGTDTNSAHGSYVNGTTTTAFPNVSASSVIGNTSPSSLGEVVTADASGNFSFTVSDNETNIDHYYIYAVQGGTVAGVNGTNPGDGNEALWAPYVQWKTGTTLDTIGINGAGGEVKYDNQTLSAITAQAQTTFTDAASLPVIRFDGFNGKDAIGSDLNETYNVQASGESDAAIYGVHVDQAAKGINLDDTGYYPLNPGQRGVGSVSIRVAADPNAPTVNGAPAVYDVYVNGTLIGFNYQTGWNDTSAVPSFTAADGQTYTGSGDGEKQGTIKLAAADDDNGNVTVTVTGQNNTKATAAITFNGGKATMAEGFSPSQVSLSSGVSQDMSFTLEDANGNAISNGLATVTFKDAPHLWLTKINDQPLTSSEIVNANSAVVTEPTPIPLWDTTNPYEAPLTLGYIGDGVNVAGVGSWVNSTNGFQTVHAYSDENGKVTLTFQDGAATYWAGGTSTPSDQGAGTGTTVTVYSPVDGGSSSTSQVYVGQNPGGWDTEGSLTW